MAQPTMELKMSFERLGELVGGLPQAAFKHTAWWGNEPSDSSAQVQCKAWLDAGFPARPNLKAQTVTFERQ